MNLIPVDSERLAIMPTQDVVEYFLSRETLGTQKTYGSTIRTFFAKSGKSFRDITPFEAISYNDFLKVNYSEATTQNRISTLKKFFEFCQEVGLIEKNPFAVVKQVKVVNHCAERFLTEKELNKLLDALKAKSQQRYVLGLVLASLGLRISEAVNLSHSDFIEAPSGGIEISLLRKGNIQQSLPIRSDVWQVIEKFMGHGPNAFITEPLFKNPSGNRCSVVTLRTWVKEASKKAGITKDISPHWIRHSTATHLLDQGVTVKNVAWLLNHANTSTTSRYLHVTDRDISGKMPIKVRND